MVLLLSSELTGTVDEACFELVSGEDPGRRNVVAVTVDRSADSFIDGWLGAGGSTDIRVLDVGTCTRSAVPRHADSTATQNVIQSVETGEDLSSILARIDVLVSEPVPAGEQRVVYVDSISDLLEYEGLGATLDFCDELGDLVRPHEFTTAVVRAGRHRHSRYQIVALSQRFDVTLSLDPEGAAGTWAIPSWCTGHDIDGTRSAALSVDDLYGLLSDRRCRLALHALYETDDSLSTIELATEMARLERPEADRPLSRMYTGLVHVHLPKLESYGVVSVDADGEAIRLQPLAQRLEPMLALTVRSDLRD